MEKELHASERQHCDFVDHEGEVDDDDEDTLFENEKTESDCEL